jgi:hypothetical protein
MSLSRHLQSKEILSALPGTRPGDLRSLLLERGRQWYADHPEETGLIGENLRRFAMSPSAELIASIQTHIILHYFEKLLPLTGGPEFYHDFLSSSVDTSQAMSLLSQARAQGKAILLATPHFGAVEFIVPCCSLAGHLTNVLLRFTTAQFSGQAQAKAAALSESGLFSPIRFIEIGKPGTMAALDMAAALRRQQMLVTVFDEKTEYSRPVNLLGTRVWGGAGLDKLIRHSQAQLALFAGYMLRLEGDRYRFTVDPIALDQDDPIQALFDSLQQKVTGHLEQWYFLHEEVPFVE